ncbi:MAG: type I DNA topoisomerase [Candidatus Gottesmanbacteria bacterium]
MKLIIVESPTKARTLSKFLGSDYQIESTMGHIRDLPKSTLGVKIKEKKEGYDFVPEYVLVDKKNPTIDILKKEAAKAEQIILATDPDREGEAIAWHVNKILKHSIPVSRISFHEITDSAIKEALNNPRQIDMQLVNAQQARRILDRLVGYKLSPLLWKKIRRGLSAGRVQSVAVRLIVEREKEIAKFQKEEYWQIFAGLKKDKQTMVFKLIRINNEKLEKRQPFSLFDGEYSVTKTDINTQDQATGIINKYIRSDFIVGDIDTQIIERSPLPPFTTSTLQQEANRRLSFPSKRTMSVAQKLYEEGKITYHRTDSVIMADYFLNAAQKFIKETYGEKYCLPYLRRYQTKQKLDQEAHEAIRPTIIEACPLEQPKNDQDRLYSLIWKRAVATQMKEAQMEKTVITVIAADGEFSAEGTRIIFPGFLLVYGDTIEDQVLPKVSINDKLQLIAFCPTQKFTEPPPRYSEAALIKALEEEGIGRPSTYAPIISTIQERQYVERDDKKKFLPTALGTTVNDFLAENFTEVVDIGFTAKMEDDLDNIAQGQNKWVPVLSEFYGPFIKKLDHVTESAKRTAVPVEKTDEICDLCGAPLVIRIGRFGKFLACSRFPDCKFTKKIVYKAGLICPKCGGDIIIKKTKKGRIFYGCSNYPNCTFAAWKKDDITSPQS